MLDGDPRTRLSDIEGPEPFSARMRSCGLDPFRATGIHVMQINTGRLCNLSCRHCHVDAGPHRTELMSRRILENCLEALRATAIPVIDVTGGSPEMNPSLEWFLGEASRLGRRLMVRSNLAILLDPAYRHFIGIYERNRVEIVTSIPDCNVQKCDRQRGAGTFGKIMEAMRLLNAIGYGLEGSGLVLDIVHNPVGAYLPGNQSALEDEYRRRLRDTQKVEFNRLFSLTNCPVGRYLEYLVDTDNYAGYMRDLARAFNPAAAANAMCRTTLSVGWDGYLYDCDFNQMLGAKVDHGAPGHIERFDFAALAGREILLGDHCYACTAGSGSSCQGVVTGAKRPV